MLARLINPGKQSIYEIVLNHSQNQLENFNFGFEKNWAARKLVNQPKHCMVKCWTVVFKLRNCLEFDDVVRRRKFYFFEPQFGF